MIGLLALAACAPAPVADGAGDSDEPPGDTADPLAERYRCGPYAPQASATLPFGEASARAVYRTSDQEVATSETMGAEVYEGWDTWVYETTTVGADASGTEVSLAVRSHYLCDVEGLKHHDITTTASHLDTAGESVIDSESRWAMHDHPLVYPIDMGLGSAWTYATRATESRDGADLEWTLEKRREIVAVETTEVTAGSFEALVLDEVDHSEPEARPANTLYLAEWVGLVKSSHLELVSFARLDL